MRPSAREQAASPGTRVPAPSSRTGTLPDTPSAQDASPRCTSRHGHGCASVRAHAGLANSRCTACRPRNGRCRKMHAPIVAGSAPAGKSQIQNRPSPRSDSSRRRSDDGRQPDGVGDQPKMMSRGRGRRASRLVPGNGGAPAPAVARRPAIDALLGLRDELDDMRGRIRSTRQAGLEVSRVRAHRAWHRSPRQCSCFDIGAGSLPRGRERTGTGA